MAEYIERDYAIREACRELCGCEPNECEFACAIVERYKNWPAANVRENVKSKWEDVEITMITEDNAPSEIVSMFCPNCKRYHNEVYHYGNPIENANFCPRCGADMTGGNDG